MTGTLRPTDHGLLDAEVEDILWHCYRSRLSRDDIFGNVSVHVQVAPDGLVEGAASLGAVADPDFQRCVDDASRRLEPNDATRGGPALVRFERFLGHAAEVRFRPQAENDVPPADEADVAAELALLGPSFETCALLDPEEVAPISVDVVIRRNGSVWVKGIERTSESTAVDTCVTGVLRTARLSSAVYQHRGLVIVRFLEALRNRGSEEG
jgi:hypothetical protein